MTKERVDEIDRMVFKRNTGYFTALNLTSEKMFELGRITERMHRDLTDELSKEVEAVDEHDSEIRADERAKVLSELRIFIDKHYENIVYELKSSGKIEDANRVIDKFAEQMKEQK